MPNSIKVKCKYCGKEIIKSQSYKIKDRFYACDEECAKNFLGSNEYYKDKLYAKLLIYYDKNSFIKLTQQVEKAIREYGVKYSGIALTLDYYIDILDMKYDNQYGIGQFLRYYQEAKDFYAEKHNKILDISNKSDDYFVDECKFISNNVCRNLNQKQYKIEEL